MGRAWHDLLERVLPRGLQARMALLVTAGVLVQILASGLIFTGLVAKLLEAQIGRRALDLAEAVAADPVVRAGLADGDPAGRVQALAEQVRRRTGAEYVVVADTAAVRLSHPDPGRLGQAFVGGDEGPVLREGRSYVSRAVGTLGPSLRGFAPVRAPDGRVLGFVAVGYLAADVQAAVRAHQQEPRVFVFMMVLIGVVCAVLIAGHVKRLTLGLEPAEIAAQYRERGTILEAVHEGIVAVGADGRVRLANRAALRHAGLGDGADADAVGRPAVELLPDLPWAPLLAGAEALSDREVAARGAVLVVNAVPVRHDGAVVGAVASFRPKDELDRLTRELSRVQQYTEMLRAQAHEHSNTLHTVAGLIQLGATDEALELLLHASGDQRALVELLAEAVPHPALAAIVIGKASRAAELKVALTVDPQSSLRDVPPDLDRDDLVTVLGNLLDNALEAARRGQGPPRVNLALTDLGRELILEVEDSGPGVPAAQAERIFARGVTTKTGPGHGLGLDLVRRALERLGGAVTVGTSPLGGALFTVIVPKHGAPGGGAGAEEPGP